MNYLSIEKCSINNGTGVRCVLWCSGCTHQCKNCHNKFSWDRNNGKRFTEKELSLIIDYLKNDYVDGITFSGGDPLSDFNYSEVLTIATHIKKILPNKTIWCYTGYTLEELKVNGKEDILKYIDVLVDGRYVDELRDLNLEFRGSSNQRILYKGKDF